MWTIVSRHAQYHLAKEKVVGAHRKVCDHFGGQAVDTPTIVFGQVVNRPPQRFCPLKAGPPLAERVARHFPCRLLTNPQSSRQSLEGRVQDLARLSTTSYSHPHEEARFSSFLKKGRDMTAIVFRQSIHRLAKGKSCRCPPSLPLRHAQGIATGGRAADS